MTTPSAAKELLNLAEQICDLAKKAGEEILPFYRNGVVVTRKEDASPLTLADSASHDFLTDTLRAILPDTIVISEESAEVERRPLAKAERFWLVDPLDGTKEFIKGTNEFTVNIALIDKGHPVLGIVHAPALDLTYDGVREGGSWRATGSEPAKGIHTREAKFSHMSVVASKDHAGPMVEQLLSRLPDPQLQSMGSSLKFCLVAEGKADLYLRDLPTMEWDTAAAQCIVEGAGGGVYSLDGKPLAYGKDGLRNPAIITVGGLSYDWSGLIS
jgi:3'(2'), 5'-bisphosphate nucleotidase